jgi:hypothetical protein
MYPGMLRFVSGLLLLGTAAIFNACEKKVAERPNIVFIFSDDHAYQAVSAYGYEIGRYAPTPNIDRIASGGVRFDRCCVTNSICAPSRATILTGKHSHMNSVLTNRERFDSPHPWVLISGRSCPDRVIITIRTSGRRKEPSG